MILRPSLELLKGSVITGRRYTYGERLQYGLHYRYGGTGTTIEANDESKVKLSIRDNINSKISLTLKFARGTDTGETFDKVTLYNGMPMGLLLSLTYNSTTQYTAHLPNGGGLINELDKGPNLEIIS